MRTSFLTISNLKIALATVFLGLIASAAEASGGQSMPWDAGLTRLSDNISGPVGSAFLVLGCAYCGIKWMTSNEEKGGMGATVKFVFAGVLMVMPFQIMSSLGITGAIL